jgi:restriction system protein
MESDNAFLNAITGIAWIVVNIAAFILFLVLMVTVGPYVLTGLLVWGIGYGIYHAIFARPDPTKQAFESYRAALAGYERSLEEERRHVELELARAKEDFWRRLDGLRFEQEIATLLRSLGHTVRLTPRSGDEGVDLFIDEDTILQCKAHSVPVSPAVVRELLGAKSYFKARKAILVSTGGFTSGATEFARKTTIELWDANTLVRLQETRRGR